MKNKIVLLFVGVFCFSVGCLPDTSGVDPPDDQFIYPVGLATTFDDRYLLVANSNFDLKYNSGTIVVVDLEKLDRLEQEKSLISPQEPLLEEDVKEVFIDEAEVIDAQDTIRLGSFASDLELTPTGNRAVIPVRADRAIVIVDIDTSGTQEKLLSCNDDGTQFCDSRHKVKSNEKHSLPIEPYEVATLSYDDLTLGFATHLDGGEVSLFIIDEYGKLTSELIAVAGNVVPGASGIVANPVRREIYVAGRRDTSPHVAIMQVKTDSKNGSYTRNPYFDDVGRINISNDLYAGTDARGLAVTKDGNTAFLVTRNPEALMRLNTDKREFEDLATLGADPSVVEVFEDDNDTPDDPRDDLTYAFALCFLTDQVYIVEPEMMQVRVRATGIGPHAVAFDQTRKRVYIANFRESTISVLEARWPFNHLYKIGKPQLPKGHN